MFRTRREVFRALNSASRVRPKCTLQHPRISSTYEEVDSTQGEIPPRAPESVSRASRPPHLGASAA